MTREEVEKVLEENGGWMSVREVWEKVETGLSTTSRVLMKMGEAREVLKKEITSESQGRDGHVHHRKINVYKYKE